ncbi:hypothetical protein [Micromonospora costi]|uniref:Uncharacterized protein n=1 Tax=Micromonospora costi TaxID=1530042 RepID=A0A3A9ZXB7_9ACTN|nr:hypothetical protein [Micromonospora costi]RKN52962.1 hypothetical protein D7193_24505 [Micromonospora costi]
MSGVRETLAVCRYEFRMQIRKRSLWITIALLAGSLAAGRFGMGPRYAPASPGAPAREVMTRWAFLFSVILPIAFGMALADRLLRDRRLRTAELLASMPPGSGGRLTGTFLGSVTATGAPALAAMLVAAGYETVRRGDPMMIPWGLAAFAAVLAPALVFVAGYALVCPLVLTAPLFRVLFVGYWFWGNLLLPATLPTPTGSLLTPIGSYAASWLLGTPVLHAGIPGPLSFLRPEPTGSAAAGSIALLVVAGLIPLLAAGLLRGRWRTA